jgi:hypothetical protein
MVDEATNRGSAYRRGLTFVNHLGTPNIDAATRRLIRQKVTQQAGKYRSKPGLRRPLKPLQYALEVPDSFSGDVASIDVVPYSQVLSFQPNTSTVASSPTIARIMPETNQDLNRPPVSLSPPLDRLGAGRFDPFIKFPITLNRRTRELVDTCEFTIL